ncbi:ribonuclease P protein component [Cycloclasticus sp. 46_83_sub15_T18]|nr:ribonuclease P protein component [Cycloclasticus sp. 46_83_sub15_T18]OUR83410.1 ribonuclease P protein component [Cycloclasticus sp. 46_120_T64]
MAKKTNPYAFTKSDRLNTAVEYSNVFKGAKKSSDSIFTVLAKKNDHSGARLGLAIAKKSVKKANQRNCIKRIVRETFRREKESLSDYDFVVLCRHKAAQANKEELARAIKRHWKKLIDE